MFSLLPSFVETSELKANSVDADQTPRSAASGLGLHCLLISLLWVKLMGKFHIQLVYSREELLDTKFTDTSHNVRKRTVTHVRSAKIQISLRIRAV